MMGSKYYIYGKYSSFRAILNPKRLIHKILVSTNFDIDSLKKLLNKSSYSKSLLNKVNMIPSKELTNILGLNSNHQGIAILTEELKHPNLELFLHSIKQFTKCTLVILDQVTDPTNIGSILRSASAFNIQAIVVPKYNSAKETSTIAKVASGALENIPLLQVTNIYNAISTLKKNNFWIIGLDSNINKDNINEINDYSNVVLVFGNEHKGLRKLTKKSCDILLKIPFNKNNIDSLNLSNAAAITFYLRYRKKYI